MSVLYASNLRTPDLKLKVVCVNEPIAVIEGPLATLIQDYNPGSFIGDDVHSLVHLGDITTKKKRLAIVLGGERNSLTLSPEGMTN